MRPGNIKSASDNSVAHFHRQLWDVFKCIPLPFIALSIYIGLRSTAIFGLEDLYSPWHPAFPGWYDCLLIVSILLTYCVSGYKRDNGIFLFVFLLAFVIAASYIANYDEVKKASIIDAYIYLLRFALLFTFGIWLVKKMNVEKAESFLFFLFLILACSSIFVYKLQSVAGFYRLYASGMTVASFSQVAAIVCLTAVRRNRLSIFLVSLLALILTFSRTSMLLFALCLLIFFCTSERFVGRRRFFMKPGGVKIFYMTLMIIVSAILLYSIVRLNPYGRLMGGLLNPEEIHTMHDRIKIWYYAMNQLLSGQVSFFGRGFNASPSPMPGRIFAPAFSHFHGIAFEYLIGLGISSVPIFVLLLRRTWQTFRACCYSSFFIYFFFLASQSIDFTFYRPKEVIIWSFLLGVAEGQWRLARRSHPAILGTEVREGAFSGEENSLLHY